MSCSLESTTRTTLHSGAKTFVTNGLSLSLSLVRTKNGHYRAKVKVISSEEEGWITLLKKKNKSTDPDKILNVRHSTTHFLHYQSIVRALTALLFLEQRIWVYVLEDPAVQAMENPAYDVEDPAADSDSDEA